MLKEKLLVNWKVGIYYKICSETYHLSCSQQKEWTIFALLLPFSNITPLKYKVSCGKYVISNTCMVLSCVLEKSVILSAGISCAPCVNVGGRNNFHATSLLINLIICIHFDFSLVSCQVLSFNVVSSVHVNINFFHSGEMVYISPECLC